MRAPDELTARPFWLIGMGSLVVAAALRSNPVGAAAWSCALLLAGSALFLFSEQNKWLTRALYAGAFGISGLPFSLTASGWVSGGTGFWLSFPFLLLSHAMLIAGYHPSLPADDHARCQREPAHLGQERLSHRHHAFTDPDHPAGTLRLGRSHCSSATGSPVLIACLLAVGLLWLTPRARILNPVRAHWVRPTSDSWLDWVYQGLWGLYPPGWDA